MENNKEAVELYCLRIADSNLIHAQRLAEWCSKGPILEEDLALTNISLDLFGQAEYFYEYISNLKEGKLSSDELAFTRNEREFINNLLVEQPNGDFSFTMMKILFFSVFSKYLYENLLNSKNEILKGLSLKALKEVKYHIRHSSEWIIRLGNGTEESNSRCQHSLNELWRFTADLFEMNNIDDTLILDGTTFNVKLFYPNWKFDIDKIFAESNLSIPENSNQITGGINGIHTESLGHILCEMQYLQRAYPNAIW